jgi:hypothetical protein
MLPIIDFLILRPSGRVGIKTSPPLQDPSLFMASLIARLQKRLLLNSSRIYLERYNRSFAQSMKTAAAVFYRLDLR